MSFAYADHHHHQHDTHSSLSSAQKTTRSTRFESSLPQNDYEKLLREREQLRLRATLHSSNGAVVGTCTEKCPTFERHERELHLDLSDFEIVQSGICFLPFCCRFPLQRTIRSFRIHE